MTFETRADAVYYRNRHAPEFRKLLKITRQEIRRITGDIEGCTPDDIKFETVTVYTVTL